MCAWLRGLSCLACLVAGLCNVGSTALAAGADNAYVSVYSMEASAAYAIDNDIYLLSEQLSSPVPELFVSVSAKDPFVLVSPESGNVRLAPGRGCGYRVRDESGSEDSFSGMIHAVKLDIAPAEKYVCWKASSSTLELTSDSAPEGVVVWSSVPAGISGRGRTISFSPNRLSPGTYTVTARLARFPNYKDTCIVHVVKVELVTPSGDPVSAPSDSGDGQNEFTYSSDSPGVLTMNLKAKVTPAGSASGVKDSCFFRVDFIRNSVMAWNATSPSGRAAVSGDSLVATVTFTGLPVNNSDFGKKKALVYFGGILCDEKDYEVFFPKEAKNHPIGQPDSPNWFYYWKQTSANSASTRLVYTNATRSFYHYFKDRTIFIANDASKTQIASWGSPRGIDCYAWTVAHESKHHLQTVNFWPVQWNADMDDDRDWLPNDKETNYMQGRAYSPLNRATYPDVYGYGEDPIPDIEDIDMRQQVQPYELDVLWSNGRANSEDWANSGKQTIKSY